jgi:hypothetical protein
MYGQLTLSDDERELLIELLECERNELPVEIHHCRNAAVRDELQARGELVRRLLGRLRPVPVAPLGAGS